MDEVDIDNVDDINDLEARLYGQIHHEATKEPNIHTNVLIESDHRNVLKDVGLETTSHTNRFLSRRYWASGEHTASEWRQGQADHSQQRFIRNPFKAPNKTQNHKQSKQIENSSDLNSLETIECRKEAENNKSLAETNSKEVALSPPSLSENNKSNKTTKPDEYSTKHKLPAEKSNLKLNPIADWMQRKKNRFNKKASSNKNNTNAKILKNSSINIKQGLFARQQEKLQKAKRIEEKRQKSRRANNSACEEKLTEIIDLDSDNESDSSDVIMIPTAPPTIFTLDDSADEDVKDKEPITMEHEENALDSTDVHMSSTTASFIKPQQISTHTLAVDSSEKHLENSSRCTSPCSIQSSDDFIGQIDRSRLLAGASIMADDEDLLVLTSDINSLLEVPDNSKQLNENICLESETNPLESSLKDVQEDAATQDSFAPPKRGNPESLPIDNRVDQGQYRALHFYESESDISDSLYSKGANKSTVIRQIDTSSDEVEDIGYCSQKKRLRKRRAPSSNKGSDHNNEHIVSSSDNEESDKEEDDDNKVLRTIIPFIAKGVAVESYKPGKRNPTLSSPIIRKRKSANKKAATDRMSDTEFIETLNNLAQGQEGEKVNPILEETDESETENVPTARDIAAKILAQHSAIENANKLATDDIALPNDVIKELDKVFETIDQLDREDANHEHSDGDIVKISDSSDSDREKHFIYKSLPDEKSQIIEYCRDTSKTQKYPERKTHAGNGSPIYNVIYSRGPRNPGGIGWNDEMRRFYNESWNGEHFTLSKVLQKMNPDKSLWKIYTEDRFNIKANKRSNMKCTNCCDFGHMRSKCKRPRKPMICYMCGDSGHYEPRCPNTICLRCGNKTQVFTKSCNVCSYQNRLTCPICKIRGHSLDYCPDKWRRYHSTTEGNTHPISSVEYNPRKFCCVCGARGHISDNCRSAFRFSEYPAISSTVKSYQKSYSDVVIKPPHNGIALNLMYKPCQEYKFDLVDHTSSDKYYGRFLNAVGMDHLLKRTYHKNSVTMEMADTTAKKAKRLAKKYEVNPYLKAATSNQKKSEFVEKPPNQVQEITESGNADEQNKEDNVRNVDDKSDNEVELIRCTVEEYNIKLNTINEIPNAEDDLRDENFKSPKKVESTPLAPPLSTKSQTEPALILDSDSSYSFSDHFDVASSSEKVSASDETPISAETSNDHERDKNYLVIARLKPKPRELEILPDFIPLIASTEIQSKQHFDTENLDIGISRRFIAAISDDEMEEHRGKLSPLLELPCEAKIYLTHFHSKYLLSPAGNAFLRKSSRNHKLRARIDFTSVGHVLIIFGLPTNQDKFQRELLLKYRELEDERNQKQLQSHLNVPKRTYILIKFLRDSITQLMNNLGNANHLLKRLQYLERQHTKSGSKLAEKVRKLLNMILVGQAGLEDGTMHLDKLLVSLKKLLTDVSDDVAPPELRSEITDHYKVIFSAYRHENYQELVDRYNRLVSKNRMPLLNIDPVLLGQKVLDTCLNEEQKQKLEQVRTPVVTNTNDTNRESIKRIMPSTVNRKNSKLLKRKQNTDTSPSTTATTTTNKTKTTTSLSVTPTNVSQSVTPTVRDYNSSSASNVKTKSTFNNTPTSVKLDKSSAMTQTPVKILDSSATSANKSKQSTSATNALPMNKMAIANETCKNQLQIVMPPPPFVNPEKRSTVSTTIQRETDKWKSTYDALLTQISSEDPISSKDLNGDKTRSSKLPSPFWSRESIRYLDNCVRLASERPQFAEKLQRVQNKSINGQLSYNDYLAIIKLHTALNGK